MNKNIGEQVSSGVETLVKQLRDEGVQAGKAEAQNIVDGAQIKANKLVLDAEAKAKVIIENAKLEAVTIEAGGKEALEIAMRDILLTLKARLAELVGDRVQRLIEAELAQEAFLKELILEMALKVKDESEIDKSKKVEFKLPSHYIGLQELQHHPLELQEGSLSHFILNIASDVLREGVSFSDAEDVFFGLKIELKDRHVVINLTADRLSEILLQHLQPRFRAILEGMVK